MNATYETAYVRGMTKQNSQPRFRVGDKVLIPYQGNIIERTVKSVFWDAEFGGWLVVCHSLGIHEQNYIPADERDMWEPHEDGLWSWWERKNQE